MYFFIKSVNSYERSEELWSAFSGFFGKMGTDLLAPSSRIQSFLP